MNPIIDPSIFYWIDVLGKLGYILFFFGVGVLAIALFYFMYILSDYEEITLGRLIYFITSIIIAVLLFTGSIFVPSESTMYKMLLAKNITPDNIETVQGELTDLIDYIIEKVDALND